MQNPEKVQEAVQVIRGAQIMRKTPRVGLVFGTGLSGAASALNVEDSVLYEDITGFPISTVHSHHGRLVFGTLADVPVVCLLGRFHLYEGYTAGEVAFGVRVLAELGIHTIVTTNAAGALNPGFEVGSLMAVADHINLTGESPLTGRNHDPWGPRFPDMSRAHDPTLVRAAMDAALRLGLRMERGVYAGIRGPQLETPAETRMLRILGADAVGMSTIMEVLAARHMGLRVLAVSALTNKNLPDCMEETSLEKVVAAAEASAADLGRLLLELAPELDRIGCGAVAP
ncbi:purine-nucleoside phosphorylase [Oceanidesulfovibrio indonesiensis]|uniref:Purine nucleoside phosphorylase n=1 Tax=Oceanidesulfovibrio indonesiensis TaxID=54767 RepID=A0A7M3MEI8_9BACT|nr:purine-nucleoside phosphorylase [Oceanidesulfovibrio indonesiensis]TVM17310.1 purine-nucleoside phosphorylase [Oceanidesulfovibrio indonesiensis]